MDIYHHLSSVPRAAIEGGFNQSLSPRNKGLIFRNTRAQLNTVYVRVRNPSGGTEVVELTIPARNFLVFPVHVVEIAGDEGSVDPTLLIEELF